MLKSRRWPLQVPGYVPIVRSTDPSGHGSWMVGEECLPGQLVFLELSGCHLGHHAPLMRTAYLLKPGEEMPEWLKEAEKLIQKTFEARIHRFFTSRRRCACP